MARLLSDPLDALRMRLAARELFALLGSPPLQQITARSHSTLPGPSPTA
jgi:hypothetical protein